MATLRSKSTQAPTYTLRATTHRNIPLLILQQPSLRLGSTSLPQSLFHVPPAPPQARPQSSLEKVCSIGRHLPAGASGYVETGYVRAVLLFIFVLAVDHFSGYYVIAIILTVITALITIFHHQIVDKLTPAAHWVKRSVLFLFGSCPIITCLGSTNPSTFQTLPLLPPFHPCSTDHNLPPYQSSRRVVNSDSHPLHHILSSSASHLPNPSFYQPLTINSHSSLGTRSLPFCVASFGVFG
jgi:hypothetical protein